MKKKALITVVCTLTMFTIVATLFTGCGGKTAITSDKFQSSCESAGLTVAESKDALYSSISQVSDSWVAIPDDRGYQIEFLLATDENAAVQLFEGSKGDKATAENCSETENGSYSSSIMTVDGKYRRCVKIGNTMMLGTTTTEDGQANVDKIMEEFGY